DLVWIGFRIWSVFIQSAGDDPTVGSGAQVEIGPAGLPDHDIIRPRSTSDRFGTKGVCAAGDYSILNGLVQTSITGGQDQVIEANWMAIPGQYRIAVNVVQV